MASDDDIKKDEDGARVLKVKAFTLDEEKPDETPKEEESKEEESKVEDEKENELPEKEDSKADNPSVPVSSFSTLDQEEEKPISIEKPAEEKLEVVKPEKKEESVDIVSEDKVSEATIDTDEKEAADPEKHKVSSEEVKKWLSDTHTEESKDMDAKRGINFKTLFLILLILGLIAVIVGGVFYYRSRVPEEVKPETEVKVERVDNITPTNSPTPTPEEELDLSEYSVQIQNGSGIPGEAGAVETLLADLEFADVVTANADSYDYTDTEVQMKEEVPSGVYDLISEELSEDYTTSKNETALDEDSLYDVVIIVGEKK